MPKAGKVGCLLYLVVWFADPAMRALLSSSKTKSETDPQE